MSNCGIEFVSSDSDLGTPCGKPAVTKCAATKGTGRMARISACVSLRDRERDGSWSLAFEEASAPPHFVFGASALLLSFLP